MWVVSGTELLRLPPAGKELQSFPLPTRKGTPVHAVTRAGDWLFVATSEGLYIERGAFRHLLTMADGLKDNRVQCVTANAGGTAWIGYYSPTGITRVEAGNGGVRLRHYTKTDGLPSDTVYSLFTDARGRLWAGTDSGAAVEEAGRFVSHDASDGLVWNDCDARAHLAEADGSVWIGTSGGLSRYQAVPRPRSEPPETLISTLLRNDEPVWGTDFDASTHSLTLRFTTLSYRRRDPVFRYRLHPVSAGWSYTRSHELRFADLPSRQYRFEVQGEAAPGLWSRPAILEFRVQPPWYLAWPFQAFAAACLASAAWGWLSRRDDIQRRIRMKLEAAVAERTAELRQAQDKLEQRVAERTSELQREVLERRAVERNLVAAKLAAEESSRAKSAFLGTMSHELRTPLNAILGYSHLLEEEAEDAADTSTLEDLKRIQAAAEHLLEMIDDILELSRLESGRIQIRTQPMCVAAYVRQAGKEAADLARKNRNTFSFEGDVPEGCMMADPEKFRRSLLNLLANACKFTHNGRVTLRVERRTAEDRDWICWRVEDNGIGIARENMDKLFQPFSQLDSSNTRKYGGTGLGLAVSQRFCQAIGGRITVESELGRGSAFTIHIPAHDEPAAG